MDPDLDGVVRVLDVDGDDVHVAIVNPDGSTAEMSGNGTRIAAAWLMERTGSDTARVHVGPRVVGVRRADGGLFESDLGEVEVGRPETVEKRLLHPELGLIEVQCQLLHDLDQLQQLLVFTATPGTESHEKLQLLAVIGQQRLSR